MLVLAVSTDSKIGPTGFTSYLWFLSMVLLAASFGTVVETNGAFSATITSVCNGLGECDTVSSSNNFPCPEYKSIFSALLPLNIVAFILSFFLMLCHLAVWSEDEDPECLGVCINVTGLLVNVLVGVEALLALYVHLAPICLFPERPEGKLSIRHGMPDMELGPTFTLLAVTTILTTVSNVWVNRRFLRSACSCACDCIGEHKRKLARAAAADKYKVLREQNAEREKRKEEKQRLREDKKQQRKKEQAEGHHDGEGRSSSAKKNKKKNKHHRAHSSGSRGKSSGEDSDAASSGSGGAGRRFVTNPLTPSPSPARTSLRSAVAALGTANHMKDIIGAPKGRRMDPYGGAGAAIDIPPQDPDDIYGVGVPSYTAPSAAMLNDVNSSAGGSGGNRKPPAFAILERKMKKTQSNEFI